MLYMLINQLELAIQEEDLLTMSKMKNQFLKISINSCKDLLKSTLIWLKDLCLLQENPMLDTTFHVSHLFYTNNLTKLTTPTRRAGKSNGYFKVSVIGGFHMSVRLPSSGQQDMRGAGGLLRKK